MYAMSEIMGKPNGTYMFKHLSPIRTCSINLEHYKRKVDFHEDKMHPSFFKISREIRNQERPTGLFCEKRRKTCFQNLEVPSEAAQ
ncbi:hypothetical protein T10_11040 [Trichinella papuae]|uniref:Uncharacterized protein n=1 Tax=Trichinella papuae TaxID=268474 RepID=A0A0V1MAL4_9BILA|nr:hypothetical protein T10_11040 [Trichinella papuae]